MKIKSGSIFRKYITGCHPLLWHRVKADESSNFIFYCNDAKKTSYVCCPAVKSLLKLSEHLHLKFFHISSLKYFKK